MPGADKSVAELKVRRKAPQGREGMERNSAKKERKRRGIRALLDSLRREYDRWGGGVMFITCVSRARV